MRALVQQNGTIAAIATPPGVGGIAVVRISGSGAYSVAEAVFRPKNPNKSLRAASGYTALFGHFVEDGALCDEVVALCFRAPHSYTGEDVVELSCHGGSAVSARLLRACCAAGAAPAGPGEFTKRAFLSGRISLTQAEAVMDLINATSRQAAAAAAAAMEGALYAKIKFVQENLVSLAGHIAAYTDYPEEDVPELSMGALEASLGCAKAALDKLIAGYDAGAVLRRGVDTAIIGSPNVGKSTLLKTALGLLPALSGEVLYSGAPLSGMPPEQVARRAAYMAQSRNVPSIEARRMVLHGRFPYLSFPRRYRKSDYAAVRRAMEKADALELADRPMQELSGGQRQKVYLAMALAQETPAVFMDEPTTFLDVRHQMDVMRTARGLADGGKAVVLVSHDLCQALRTADRVALLADGRLCMAGTPEQVYAGGALDRVFGVRVRRVPVDGDWQYFCE